MCSKKAEAYSFGYRQTYKLTIIGLFKIVDIFYVLSS